MNIIMYNTETEKNKTKTDFKKREKKEWKYG